MYLNAIDIQKEHCWLMNERGLFVPTFGWADPLTFKPGSPTALEVARVCRLPLFANVIRQQQCGLFAPFPDSPHYELLFMLPFTPYARSYSIYSTGGGTFIVQTLPHSSPLVPWPNEAHSSCHYWFCSLASVVAWPPAIAPFSHAKLLPQARHNDRQGGYIGQHRRCNRYC